MRFKVFPYKLGSASAKALAESLGIKRVRPTYDARRKDIIINWGNSRPSAILQADHDLNKHEAIALACNKLKTFQTLEAAGFEHLPIWSDDRYEITNLMAAHDLPVYCRQTLTGHSGSGIVIAERYDQIIDAPLYTLKTKHKYEYRAHVFKGKIIDVQQKKKKLGHAVSNSGIRNHSNGWIYARCNISPPDIILTASIKAVNILGLDFGAVDIGYRERDNKAFVFEVNTAPGLYGTTLDKYTQAFNNYLGELNG